MGARTNFTIVTTFDPAQNLNVYGHWAGEDGVALLHQAVQAAMPRIKMGDFSYATRIIVDQLTKDGRDSETGFGLYVGSEITHEEEYEYKEVDLLQHTVTIGQLTLPLDEFINAVV